MLASKFKNFLHQPLSLLLWMMIYHLVSPVDLIAVVAVLAVVVDSDVAGFERSDHLLVGSYGATNAFVDLWLDIFYHFVDENENPLHVHFHHLHDCFY